MASFHHSIKSGKKGSALEHACYIERFGRFRRRGEDVLHTGYGNMPPWAATNPTLFWRLADLHERANGAAYREHEIALPIELTTDQLVTLVERLIRELVRNKPYQYAIHAPEGRLGGVLNPHVHLMYSDRIPDGIDRPAAQVFARYNPNRPETGGWRKDSGGRSPWDLRVEVMDIRRRIAELQNEMLGQLGHTARVDHRSLRDQGLQRAPEVHLGPAVVRSMSDDDRMAYTAGRVVG